MRNLKWLPLLLLTLIGTALRAETVAKLPAPTGYVDDYAGVFSSPVQSQMESLCKELHDKTKAQIFVVTVNTLDGESVEQFANNLFHTWKIGEKKTDRGALLLFAIKDHRWRIEVGYGLEGILNDAKVGEIGRALVPDLHAANYDNAAQLGLRAVAQAIADDSKVQLAALQTATPQPVSVEQPATADNSSNLSPGWVVVIVIAGIVGFVGIFVLILIKGKNKSWSTSWGSSDIDHSSSSSSEDSSSSESFSGGDGGDSGGGGASGSW